MPGTTKQMSSAKNVRPRKLLTSLFAIMLCIVLFTSQISALTMVPADTVDGNPKLETGCVRFNSPEGEQTWTIASTGVETNPEEDFEPADFSVQTTITGNEETGETLSFVSNYDVCKVVVKGGDGANVYTFDPAVKEATGLHAPVNESGKFADVSHIDFCFCEESDMPKIDVEKEILVGDNWMDADEPGLELFEPEDGKVEFRFTIKNTGNVDLTDITLEDDTYNALLQAALLEKMIPDTLKPGESFWVTIKADWHEDEHCNIATAMGKYDKYDVKDTDKACYEGIVKDMPKIDVEKEILVGDNWMDADEPGLELFEPEDGKVEFRFTIKNTGNVDLTDITLEDDTYNALLQAALLEKMIPDTLKPGESFWVTIKADWHEDEHCNIATAMGKYDEYVKDTDKACYEGIVKANPKIDVKKSVADAADGTFGKLIVIEEGAFAFYKVAVRNTGNVALMNVILTDDRVAAGTVATIEGGGTKTFAMGAGAYPEINLGTLDAGEEVVVTYMYETTSEDVEEVQIDNEATATGSFGNTTVSDSDTASIIVEGGPPLASSGIKLEKWVENTTAGGTPDESATGFAGDVFKYTIKITNTGDTALSNVVLHDDWAMVGTAVSVTATGIQATAVTVLMWADDGNGHAKLDLGVLPAGVTLTFTYLYTADADDVGKNLKNTAIVNAEFEGIPLESSDVATISIQKNPPQTGESDSRTLSGIALILFSAIALVLRRRYGLNA